MCVRICHTDWYFVSLMMNFRVQLCTCMCENSGSANHNWVWESSTRSIYEIQQALLWTDLFHQLLSLNNHYRWGRAKIIAADRCLTSLTQTVVVIIKSIRSNLYFAFIIQLQKHVYPTSLQEESEMACSYKHRSDKGARAIPNTLANW